MVGCCLRRIGSGRLSIHHRAIRESASSASVHNTMNNFKTRWGQMSMLHLNPRRIVLSPGRRGSRSLPPPSGPRAQFRGCGQMRNGLRSGGLSCHNSTRSGCAQSWRIPSIFVRVTPRLGLPCSPKSGYGDGRPGVRPRRTYPCGSIVGGRIALA